MSESFVEGPGAAITGRTVSPPLFETIAVLGRERCLVRLHAARGVLG